MDTLRLSRENPILFRPPRRRGVFLHLGVALLLIAGAAGGLYFALGEQAGAYFLLYLVLGIVCLLPLPLVLYRGFALFRAGYLLERDGLRLRWGLRSEDIPLHLVEWIRPAAELGINLPLPSFSVTGAILGKHDVPDLGPVEFLAAERENMLVVATASKAFAISPDDVKGFLKAYQQVAELGSLNPIPQGSIVPAVLVRQVWSDRVMRFLMLGGLVLTVILFLVVSIAIPNRSAVSIGFSALGLPNEPVNPVRLLLLPILGALTYAADAIGAFYFYRKPNYTAIAYMLLGAGLLVLVLLILAVVIIL